jgi:hypothetical protein
MTAKECFHPRSQRRYLGLFQWCTHCGALGSFDVLGKTVVWELPSVHLGLPEASGIDSP